MEKRYVFGSGCTHEPTQTVSGSDWLAGCLKVDLWSCGVIMFLTLRAKLPFHDTTKNRIIARILRQNVQMVDPQWKKVSKEAKDLISKLLIKNPAQRISCTQVWGRGDH